MTVNYFTETEIEALVASLRPQRCPWELVVLDNGSTETGKRRLTQLAATAANIRHHDCGQNLGYFGAAHRYISGVSADSLPEWLVLTNPDVVFDEDFLERLHEVDADV